MTLPIALSIPIAPQKSLDKRRFIPTAPEHGPIMPGHQIQEHPDYRK